jgi:hypothetical protein
LLADVYSRNRATLTSIGQWIEPGVLEKSLWRYGVPAEWTIPQGNAIDRTGLSDVENDITAADLLGFVARQLRQPVSYLEIGVSVGKTLLQMECQVTGAHLVGLDIEELNPTLRGQFDCCEQSWAGTNFYLVETLSGSKVNKRPTLQKLIDKRRNNVFEYLSADQFRDDTWQQLDGYRFNLIFSDGVHSGKALLSEFSFLVGHDLIDTSRPFVWFWDDLWDMDMQSAFFSNATKLCSLLDVGEEAISIFVLHGSYGVKRPMGMFKSGPL